MTETAHNAFLADVDEDFLFEIGDIVRKKSGAAWEGRVCGFYRTALTPAGYAVESSAHPGIVQIYPGGALEIVTLHEDT